MELKKGQFVEFDGLPAVVVGLPGETDVPEDHVALWFGDPHAIRRSRGGVGGISPEVWTVPADLCEAAMAPIVRH